MERLEKGLERLAKEDGEIIEGGWRDYRRGWREGGWRD